MLDVLNTVGLSDSLLRVIDRRHKMDRWLTYGGMVSCTTRVNGGPQARPLFDEYRVIGRVFRRSVCRSCLSLCGGGTSDSTFGMCHCIWTELSEFQLFNGCFTSHSEQQRL